MGKGGRNAPLQGCLGRRSGPGARISPRSQPPRAPLAPCFHPETPSVSSAELSHLSLSLKNLGRAWGARKGGEEGASPAPNPGAGRGSPSGLRPTLRPIGFGRGSSLPEPRGASLSTSQAEPGGGRWGRGAVNPTECITRPNPGRPPSRFPSCIHCRAASLSPGRLNTQTKPRKPKFSTFVISRDLLLLVWGQNQHTERKRKRKRPRANSPNS